MHNRCFPCCNSAGHSDFGFCGSSIVAMLEIPIAAESPSCHRYDTFWRRIQYIAEIRCKVDEGLSSTWSVSKEYVSSQLRSKARKGNPYITGRCVSIETLSNHDILCAKKITIEFNSEKNAWHYGWVSHKHSNLTSHVVDISVLVENRRSPDTLFVAGAFVSPEFTVTCTKRQRTDKNSPKRSHISSSIQCVSEYVINKDQEQKKCDHCGKLGTKNKRLRVRKQEEVCVQDECVTGEEDTTPDKYCVPIAQEEIDPYHPTLRNLWHSVV